MAAARSIFDKIWDRHAITTRDDGTALLYIDTLLVQENVFHAFDRLKRDGRAVRCPDQVFAFTDHYAPTRDRANGIPDAEARNMIEMMRRNTDEHGITLFGLDDPRHGILHIVPPEQGITQPGAIIAGADSHSSTHGALGAFAFGVGASEVAHVLATQTLWRRRPRTMRIDVPDPLPAGATAKDLILAIIGHIGTDVGAAFDREVTIHAADLAPMVTWGTSPEDVAPITGRVPDPADEPDRGRREKMERALGYMALAPGTRLTDIAIDRVFIGSCTNGRIEDLRAVAGVVKGRQARVAAMIVPGSALVKAQAEAEGLDTIFREAGFEWRDAGCSMCVATNGDMLAPGERCASTSNRNFEGRQGRGGRTHLLSPAMAAAAAVTGRLTDVRALTGGG